MADFQAFTTLLYDPRLLDIASQGFTTTEWNQKPSPWYMLDFHRDRLTKTVQHFDWPTAEKVLEGLVDHLDQAAQDKEKRAYRVKILLTEHGHLGSEWASLAGPAVPLNNLFPSLLPAPRDTGAADARETDTSKPPSQEAGWRVVLDSGRTTASTFTHHKTTARDVYAAATARSGASLPRKTEVLLVNGRDGSVMEGSVTTAYFWRSGRWVTPPVSPGYRPGSGSGGNEGTTRRWALETRLVEEEVVKADDLRDGEECWLSNGVRGFIWARISL